MHIHTAAPLRKTQALASGKGRVRLLLIAFITICVAGQVPARAEPDLELIIEDADAIWVIPAGSIEFGKPRFVDRKGLAKELAKYTKGLGKAPSVLIAAPDDGPHQWVTETLEICANAGVTDLAAKTFEKAEPGDEPALVELERAPEGRQAGAEPVPVAAAIDGEVIAVRVRVGDRVKKGELLVELDTTEAKVRLDIARAAIDIAKAELEIAEAQHEAAKRIHALLERRFKEGGAAQTEIFEAELGVRSSGAGLHRAAALLNMSKAEAVLHEIHLERSQIKASFDGVVTKVEVHAGQPIVRVQRLLWLSETDPDEG